jgi:hypothetical protein
MYPTAEGFHAGTNGRRDRFTQDEWAGIDTFPFRSAELHGATARQLALFGFPPPRHPYWTEATIAGTAPRYPGLDMTPWQQALGGQA